MKSIPLLLFTFKKFENDNEYSWTTVMQVLTVRAQDLHGTVGFIFVESVLTVSVFCKQNGIQHLHQLWRSTVQYSTVLEGVGTRAGSGTYVHEGKGLLVIITVFM
jgi:hypothetical protein